MLVCTAVNYIFFITVNVNFIANAGVYYCKLHFFYYSKCKFYNSHFFMFLYP